MTPDAEAILAWLRHKQLAEFGSREILAAGLPGIADARTVRCAMSELRRARIVERVRPRFRTGRPAVRWRLVSS